MKISGINVLNFMYSKYFWYTNQFIEILALSNARITQMRQKRYFKNLEKANFVEFDVFIIYFCYTCIFLISTFSYKKNNNDTKDKKSSIIIVLLKLIRLLYLKNKILISTIFS